MPSPHKTDTRIAVALLAILSAAALLTGCTGGNGNGGEGNVPAGQAAPVLKGEQAAALQATVQQDVVSANRAAATWLAETGVAPKTYADLQSEGFRPTPGVVVTYVAAGPADWCISVYNPLAATANTPTTTVRITAAGGATPVGTPGAGACAGRT